MFADELDEEEVIDVITAADGAVEYGADQFPDEDDVDAYMINQPEGDGYDDEGVPQYERYMSEVVDDDGHNYNHDDGTQQYLPMGQFVEDVGILGNQDLYNAHYIDIDDELVMAHKNEILMCDDYGNPFVDNRTTEERLSALPEMYQLPVFRRAKKSRPMEEHPVLSRPTQVSENVFDRGEEGTKLLNAVNFWPKREASNEPPPQVTPSRREDMLARIASTIRQAEGPAPTRFAGSPLNKKRQAIPPPNKPMPKSLPLTPLPDRFYQKRLTLTADQVGFVSECVACNICGFMFRHRPLLENHILKHQQTGLDKVMSDRAGLICPMKECQKKSDSIATVIEHLKKAHPQVGPINFEQIHFKDSTEFHHWKTELEKLTLSRFSRTSGKQNVFSRSTYYQCHHSGLKANKKEHRQRARESKKLGKTCTAFFHVRENENGTLLLRGCTKHIGHGCDVRCLPLSDEIRMEIAQLLIAGLDEVDIVEKFQQEVDKKDRRYYLQHYEIRNVASKIDKIKEDFKRRIAAGHPLPDFAEMLTSPTHRTYPIRRARLGCHTLPVVEEDGTYVEVMEQDPAYEEEYYDEQEEQEGEEEEEYDEEEYEEYVDPQMPSTSSAPPPPPPSTAQKRQERKRAGSKKRTVTRRPKIVPEGHEGPESDAKESEDEQQQQTAS